MSAIISDCGTYRYLLTRATGVTLFESQARTVNFIMLNPSTADATADDPTIRRCIRFAMAWDYERLVVTNLFAFRATDPGDLRHAPDPIGPENNPHIARAAAAADLVVFAWGREGGYRGRSRMVRSLLSGLTQRPPCYLRLTKNGEPWHPLYVPADTTPTPWSDPP